MTGITILSTLFAGGPAALVAKATLVLAATTGVALVQRRASAALRHLVWAVGLAACVILTFVTPLTPAIPLALMEPQVVETASSSVVALPAVAPALPVSSSVPNTASFQRVAVQGDGPAPRRSVVVESSRWIADHATVLAGIAWLVGCALVLARCALGHLVVARIVRRSELVRSAEWDALLVDAASAVGVRRDVVLLSCDELTTPITSGWVNPLVILPAEADDWSAERKRVVLVHELAHVERLDYVTQLVATVAAALFWFHPLMWLAVSQLRAEAEQAADDRVIAAGTAGVVYATHLLEIARAGRRLPLAAAVAVGMVRSSRLETRFRALLDTTRSRAVLSSRVAALTTSAAMAAMIPLAGLRAVVGPSRSHVDQPPAVAAASTRGLTATFATTRATPTTGSSAVTTRSMSDSTFETTVAAHDGGLVRLEMPTGGGLIVHGWNESRVRMRVSLGGADWRQVRVSLEPTGNDVKLRSRFLDGGSHSTELYFELWVPRRSDIALSSAGGSVDIDNVSGELTGHTGGGEITIRNVGGSTSLSTGGGDIRVSDSNLDGRVTTGWGRIIVQNVTGNLRGSSPTGGGESLDASGARGAGMSIGGSNDSDWGSSVSRALTSAARTLTSVGRTLNSADWGGTLIGNSGGMGVGTGMGVGGCNGMTSSSTGVTTMSYSGSGGRTTTTTNTNTNTYASNFGVGGETVGRRASATQGAFSVSKAGGDIALFDSLTTASVSTGGGNIFVALATTLVVASTGGGSVEVAHLGGDANVWTGAGDVTLSVANDEGSEHTIAVCSGQGRVVLELPAHLDATLDLETAYTENYDRRPSIQSDFSVDPSETTEWDDRFGTPRKFVRASGRVGNGRGVIRVRTVNGDIVVRRR